MRPQPQIMLAGLLFLSGCLYHAREHADQAVCDLAAHPFDLQPPSALVPDPDTPSGETKPAGTPTPVAPEKNTGVLPAVPLDVQTTAFMQADQAVDQPPPEKRKLDVEIPATIPGAEAPRIELPKDKAEKLRAIDRLYPELPPLSVEPVPLPGPDGHPYTLADLQHIAAENSPTLRQAASDVEAAKGNLIQAKAYPDPTVGLSVSPSNDGSAPGVWGPFVNQTIKTGGKLKLQAAAAEVDLRNAELALKRARSDLSTQVRNAYFALLVAKETVRINRALAYFTDRIYRLQAGVQGGGFAAPYEPAALRAQAYTVRLALKQSIATYVYTWKQLVAIVGLRQLPLTEVAGRIDRAIPYFDYDAVLAHVLHDHTDVLTATNGIDKARFNLKLQQVTPAFPDVSLSVTVGKEYVLPPKQWAPTVSLGVPVPIWNTNKGNIIAAESALVRATEEPHRVETNLTNTLATAYAGYKNNLDALEYYRRYILPDQVRAYRGVYARRQIDQASAFGDLVQAQQTLAANVTTYLSLLGQLWTSVVSVADLVQTDDLYQLGHSQEIPELPDLEHLLPWPCCHDCAHGEGPCHGSVAETSLQSPLPVPALPGSSHPVPMRLEELTAPAEEKKSEVAPR